MLIFMSTWTVLKDLVKKSCLIKNIFTALLKDGTTGDNGKKLDGHISDKDIWLGKKFGMSLTWKIWVIITTIIWKKMYYY